MNEIEAFLILLMFIFLLILQICDFLRHLLCLFAAGVDVPLILLDRLLLVVEAARDVVLDVGQRDLGVLREDLQHKKWGHQSFLVDVYLKKTL